MRPGTRLGPYEIVGQIGAGGMGEVYRARDARLRRDVAVKVLPAAFSEDAERLLRFEQEARATAALNHPNILAIFDVGSHESRPYLVEELLSGRSLRECLKSGPPPVSKAIELAVQITSGLAAAHGKGIVHRDLKPENLFVTSDGAVKILDFGLAKLARPEVAGEAAATATATPSTGSGTVLGTVGYMAPEQIRGQPCDHRADIFAFGCVLYEMLSGQRTFSGGTPADTLAAILSQDPAPLSGTGREVPPLLAGIVSRCLQKSPEERFQSARDLVFQLDMMARLSGVASGPTAPTDVPRPRGLRRAILAGAGLAAVVLVLGAGALLDRQLGRRSQGFPDVRFTPLTFRRGVVSGAGFTGDGQTVVYSAKWDGAPNELFSTRLGSPASAALGYDRAALRDVSPTGELALLRVGGSWGLAVAPFSGGTPRDIDVRISDASYAPDGRSMAVIRETDGGIGSSSPSAPSAPRASSVSLASPRMGRDWPLSRTGSLTPLRGLGAWTRSCA